MGGLEMAKKNLLQIKVKHHGDLAAKYGYLVALKALFKGHDFSEHEISRFRYRMSYGLFVARAVFGDLFRFKFSLIPVTIKNCRIASHSAQEAAINAAIAEFSTMENVVSLPFEVSL